MPLQDFRIAGFALEETPGTVPESFTTIPCVSAEFVPQTTLVSRPRTYAYGQMKSAATNFPGTAEIVVEAAGKGSSGLPAYASLFRGCGMGVASQVLSNTSDTTAHKTISLAGYYNGLLTVLSGCMGTWVFNAVKNDTPKFTFAFQGLWTGTTDVAFPAAPTALNPPVVDGAALAFDGAYNPLINSFTITQGANVAMRPNNTAWVGTRQGQLVADPETGLVASYDIWAKYRGVLEIATSYVLNGGTNNTITFAAAKCEVATLPFQNRNGILVNNLTTNINDDSLTITFS